MADQLALTLEAFKNGRSVRSLATGKTGVIVGTALVNRVERGQAKLQLNVKVQWEDGREYPVASYALEVIEGGNVSTTAS